MTRQNTPNPLSNIILDSIRGELSPVESEALEARFSAEPALAAHRDRLRAMLVAEQAAQLGALDDTLDPKAADRMATRILDRSRRESDRRPAVPGRQRMWARLLAASVAVHVVALGFLSWRHFQSPDRAEDVRPGESVRVTPYDPADPTVGDGAVEDELQRAGIENTLPGRYVLDDEQPPIFEIPDVLPAASISSSDKLLASLPRGRARAMWLRTNDSMKRRIEARVGSEGSLDRVKAGLTALARLQNRDGSFVDAEGRSSIRATATVLLAYLSDGHSSRGGEHRPVVERGIGWVADHLDDHGASGDRALALFALAEDLILSSGFLTPAQAQVQRASLTPLAESVRSARNDARRAGTPGAPADLDARWTELALVAASHAGLIGGTTVVATMTFDVGRMIPGNDASTAMLDGTSLLKDPRWKDRREAAFTTWNTATARTLSSRLGADGLASGSGSAAARAELTALMLLALEVAYRTY